MFREMRRKAQQLPEEECIDILKRATSGVLAVYGDDGYPYAVPVSHERSPFTALRMATRSTRSAGMGRFLSA